MEGRSGCKHQIDVYWEYENNGVVHRVAIECKNYNNAVSKGKVCAFQGVLSDLDNIEGIMITKKSYQSGARKYAKQYGILLKELREPEYGETIIGKFEQNFHIEMRQTLFKVDEIWANEHNIDLEGYKQRMDFISVHKTHKWSNAAHIPLPYKDRLIRNSAGIIITTLDILEKQIPDHPTNDFPIVFQYDDAYISTSWGSVKILEIMYAYEIEDRKNIISIDAEGFVKAILKDAFNDKTILW